MAICKPDHSFPHSLTYAPATRFSLIPSGLENPGPTVVPSTVYPATAAAPHPARIEAVKARTEAANVEVKEVEKAIFLSRTLCFDCNLLSVWEVRTYRFIEGTATEEILVHHLKLNSAGSVCERLTLFAQ